MSSHAAFRRQPVPGQYAQALQTITIPAPTRGIIQSENAAFMQPGGAQVQDNWVSTMRGIKLRGGCTRWCELPETTPVISAFEYEDANIDKMFAANAEKLYDVSATIPIEVVSGQHSGNWTAVQLANAADRWMIAVNDSGVDYPLRFNGVAWEVLDHTLGTPPSNLITGPASTPVEYGLGLVHVCKYRNRLYFIELNSMNAWYLGIDAVGGLLNLIPLSGAASKGGKLLFSAVWSADTGDGLDDKLVFATDLGELLVFTGTNPADAANWRQEGRFSISTPLGMNAHFTIGGDLMIMTYDGIVPVSQATQKDAGALELAMITRAIKPMWREEVDDKRDKPWTAKKWDRYGGIFVAMPGGTGARKYCLGVNDATGAWCRFTWDATCWLLRNQELFFGTQNGIIMHADDGGYDDGLPYVATMVGGWEQFGSGAGQTVWHQARAVFIARPSEPFIPQLTSTTDYVVTIPAPPPAGIDPGPSDYWGEGLWDEAEWDASSAPASTQRNTMWVSIGSSGFAHAPIVQVTVAQAARPNVELIAISTVQERGGVNV